MTKPSKPIPNLHFSQGSIFAGSGGTKRSWGVVSWQEVVLESVHRLRGGTFSAPELDLGHGSA